MAGKNLEMAGERRELCCHVYVCDYMRASSFLRFELELSFEFSWLSSSTSGSCLIQAEDFEKSWRLCSVVGTLSSLTEKVEHRGNCSAAEPLSCLTPPPGRGVQAFWAPDPDGAWEVWSPHGSTGSGSVTRKHSFIHYIIYVWIFVKFVFLS